MHTLGWLRDRLGFTHGEVRAAVLLGVALGIGHGIRFLDARPTTTATDHDYRTLDSIFAARSDAARASVAAPRSEPRGALLPRGPVNINSADEVELAGLPGIGPVYARRIIAYRQAHGAFRSVEQLLDVSGIGPKRLASLRPLIVIR